VRVSRAYKRRRLLSPISARRSVVQPLTSIRHAHIDRGTFRMYTSFGVREDDSYTRRGRVERRTGGTYVCGAQRRSKALGGGAGSTVTWGPRVLRLRTLYFVVSFSQLGLVFSWLNFSWPHSRPPWRSLGSRFVGGPGSLNRSKTGFLRRWRQPLSS